MATLPFPWPDASEAERPSAVRGRSGTGLNGWPKARCGGGSAADDELTERRKLTGFNGNPFFETTSGKRRAGAGGSSMVGTGGGGAGAGIGVGVTERRREAVGARIAFGGGSRRRGSPVTLSTLLVLSLLSVRR